MKKNIYTNRFQKAISLVKKYQQFIQDNPNTFLLYHNEVLKGQFVINDNEIYFKTNTNCCIIVFTNNKELDEGANTTVKQFKKEFKENWKILKEIIL